MKAIIRRVHSTHQLTPQVSFFLFFFDNQVSFFWIDGLEFFLFKALGIKFRLIALIFQSI